MSIYRPKGLLRLTKYGRRYPAEARPYPELGAVRLELHRDDCKPGPVLSLALDQARELLRHLQGACDEAYRLAKTAEKQARKQAELDRVVDRVAVALGGKP